MKIGILRIGLVEDKVLESLRDKLKTAFPRTECEILQSVLPLAMDALSRQRGQYRSDILLAHIGSYVYKKVKNFDKVLGVTEADIFVPGLNFVFGQAECPGRVAIISLYRLRPELYGEASDFKLLIDRCLKEAVHELGHTTGLGHCNNSFCVMYFSNSILDTDRKKSLFCKKCQLRILNFLEAKIDNEQF